MSRVWLIGTPELRQALAAYEVALRREGMSAADALARTISVEAFLEHPAAAPLQIRVSPVPEPHVSVAGS